MISSVFSSWIINEFHNVFCLFFYVRNWELPLNGGTPYDSNVELDPSAETKGYLLKTIKEKDVESNWM
jgi:hypothetical protein